MHIHLAFTGEDGGDQSMINVILAHQFKASNFGITKVDFSRCSIGEHLR